MVSLLSDVQSKKPHLRLKHGVWSCVTFSPLNGWMAYQFRVGYGYSPLAAYRDWKKQEFA